MLDLTRYEDVTESPEDSDMNRRRCVAIHILTIWNFDSFFPLVRPQPHREKYRTGCSPRSMSFSEAHNQVGGNTLSNILPFAKPAYCDQRDADAELTILSLPYICHMQRWTEGHSEAEGRGEHGGCWAVKCRSSVALIIGTSCVSFPFHPHPPSSHHDDCAPT